MMKYIPLILFTVLSNFSSQVLLKKGMSSFSDLDVSSAGYFKSSLDIILNPFVFGGLLVMVISMASHLIVLSKVEISFAYPFLGLSFVLTTLWGYFVLSEGVNIYRVMGVLLICGGVALVAKS